MECCLELSGNSSSVKYHPCPRPKSLSVFISSKTIEVTPALAAGLGGLVTVKQFRGSGCHNFLEDRYHSICHMPKSLPVFISSKTIEVTLGSWIMGGGLSKGETAYHNM